MAPTFFLRGAVVLGVLGAFEARLSLELDGSWNFALDPGDPATRRLAGAGRKVSGSIEVPGAWQAQGYGEETDALLHQYMGMATYTKEVALPAAYLDSSTFRLFFVAERVERSAKLFIGDTLICEHTGYLTPLDCEVTPTSVSTEGKISIRLVVNSVKKAGVDGLLGEQDLMTDGTNLGGWGGVGGHVRVEARPREGWIVDPWIRHDLADSFESASVNATVTLGGAASASAALFLNLNVYDSQHNPVVKSRGHCDPNAFCTTSDVQVKSPALWSPTTPAQYSALLELVTASGKVIDSKEVTFGIKKLETVGYHFKLNGMWLYLHGYGDDCIYPDTLAPPVSQDVYAKRLAVAKDVGMNFVRHHSHILPDEYFHAACEAGIMVSAEFPWAYGGEDANCPGTSCDTSNEEQWAGTVRRLRNFPCVFDYTMDNEDNNIANAKKLYAIAKTLDPTRFVNTADGIFGDPVNPIPNPQDFIPLQPDVMSIPLGAPHWAAIDGIPPVPVISHEMGNFVTWPRFDVQMSRFNDTLKPYWLTGARDIVQKRGLMVENDLWSYCSRQLFLACWKNQMEALRKTEKMSGYEWWLLQDFWMGSNGIVDTYFVSKHPQNELDQIKNMNSAVMILAAEPADNLPLSDSAPRLLRAYTSKDTLRTSIFVSNQGATHITGATLRWQVIGSRVAGNKTDNICSGTVANQHIQQSPGATNIIAISCNLPDLGTFVQSPMAPLTLTLMVQLQDASGKSLAENQWRSRVFAAAVDGPSPADHRVYTTAKFCGLIPINNMLCSLPAAGTKLPPGSVVVVDTLDAAVLGFATEGATVLMLKGEGPSAFGGFTTDPASFKTAWWLGSAADSNMGTVVYNRSNVITAEMAPEGWADESWYDLVTGGQNFLLEGEIQEGVDVLIRSIDLMGNAGAAATLQDNPYTPLARNKALVWQAGIVATPADGTSSLVTAGAIVASGLNLLVNDFASGRAAPLGAARKPPRPEYYGPKSTAMAVDSRGSMHAASVSSGSGAKPEAAWLLHKLLEYAFSSPRPSKALEAKINLCPGCLPAATWSLCAVKNTKEVRSGSWSDWPVMLTGLAAKAQNMSNHFEFFM